MYESSMVLVIDEYNNFTFNSTLYHLRYAMLIMLCYALYMYMYTPGLMQAKLLLS